MNEENIGEEVGVIYSGTITKNPSDVEVNLDGNTSSIQVTLEDLGLQTLEEIVIEKNRVKQIKKNGNSYHIEEEGNSENQGESIKDSVDNKELEKLKNEMMGKIHFLEKELKSTRNELDQKIDNTQKELENIVISLDLATREVVFEGEANTANTTYLIQDISKYKYLLVYTDYYYLISWCFDNNTTKSFV